MRSAPSTCRIRCARRSSARLAHCARTAISQICCGPIDMRTHSKILRASGNNEENAGFFRLLSHFFPTPLARSGRTHLRAYCNSANLLRSDRPRPSLAGKCFGVADDARNGLRLPRDCRWDSRWGPQRATLIEGVHEGPGAPEARRTGGCAARFPPVAEAPPPRQEARATSRSLTLPKRCRQSYCPPSSAAHQPAARAKENVPSQ